jgi:hypothetical protein
VRADAAAAMMRALGRGAAATLSLVAALVLSACAVKPPSFPTVATPAYPPPPPVPEYPQLATAGGVEAEIIRWFSAAGYRPYQAAALAERARIESGYRVCAAGARGLRFLYQWSGARLRNLYQFAGERGCPPLDTQLAFTDHELRTVPDYACFWLATTEAGALAELRRGFARGHC